MRRLTCGFLYVMLVAGPVCAGAPAGGAADEASAAPAIHRETPLRGPGTSLHERETLTDGWFGAAPALEEQGLTLGLSATQVYQGVVHGETTHRHAGRWAGSYDLEIEADMDALANLDGGRVYVLTEGSWSDGLDASSVGSLFGVNDDAGGDRSADVTEFWYEHAFADGRVRVRLGKMDLTGGFECHDQPVAFDGNVYANDETTQFLNGALVNNPAIPFPDYGIGLAVHVEPVDGWYASTAIADAQADVREVGFNTAFDREDYTFSIVEVGHVGELPSPHGPLPGAVRVGLWYDPQPKARFDGRGSERDDVGFYASADQMLLREGDDPASGEGLGLFVRFGWADEAVNPIGTFWSAGCQYRGLVPGRDDDVLGVGMARARASDEPGTGFTSAHETAVEAYYAVQVTPWLSVSPHVQYVADPGALDGVDDAVIMGVRVQAAF